MTQFIKHAIKNKIVQSRYAQHLPLKVNSYYDIFKYSKRFVIILQNIQVRHLNLLECHSKDLLNQYGVTVQKFKIVENLDDTNDLVKSFGK